MNCFKFNSVLFLFVCLIRHTRTHIYLVVTTANIFFCIGYPIIKRWMVGNFSINRFHPPHLSTFSSQLLWNRHIYPPSQTSYCISHAICLDPTCVQWVEVRDSCPFPWYWWMAVSSLFKLYLMNIASDWDVR